jgi:hypothetical protein
MEYLTGLNTEESYKASSFIEALSLADRRNVTSLLTTVLGVSYRYLLSEEPKKCYSHFRRVKRDSDLQEMLGKPFFALYLTAGCVTKDHSADMDFLLAHNAYWEHGFFQPQYCDDPDRWEPVYRELWKTFSPVAKIRILPEERLPDNYSSKAALIRIDHMMEGRRLDIIYRRSTNGHLKFISEAELLTLDVDRRKEPYPKIPLLRIS